MLWEILPRSLLAFVSDAAPHLPCKFWSSTPILTPSVSKAISVSLYAQVVSKEDLAETADAVLREALKLPDAGRILTKRRLHGDFSRAWEAQAKTEAELGWSMLSQDSTVAALGAVLKRLQSGGKPKAKM